MGEKDIAKRTADMTRPDLTLADGTTVTKTNALDIAQDSHKYYDSLFRPEWTGPDDIADEDLVTQPIGEEHDLYDIGITDTMIAKCADACPRNNTTGRGTLTTEHWQSLFHTHPEAAEHMACIFNQRLMHTRRHDTTTTPRPTTAPSTTTDAATLRTADERRHHGAAEPRRHDEDPPQGMQGQGYDDATRRRQDYDDTTRRRTRLRDYINHGIPMPSQTRRGRDANILAAPHREDPAAHQHALEEHRQHGTHDDDSTDGADAGAARTASQR